ncbi:hypothetical protein KY316_02945 [Candidatus Woesearchaeota archaeon]|nr:hypothetical protein [Candidatus Woesearchaeota archaeon]
MKKSIIPIILMFLFANIACASTLTVTYSTAGAEECNDYCVYMVQSAYTIGIASPVAVSKDTSMSLTSEISASDDDAYLIFTQGNTDVSSRESYLREKSFDNLFDPSFGYPVKGISKVRVGLRYSDIYLNSSSLKNAIGPGLYSIIFRNRGQLSSGKTHVLLELT